MTAKVRPYSAGNCEQKSISYHQHPRPSTAGNQFKLSHHNSSSHSKLSQSQSSRKCQSWDATSRNVVRPTSALQRTELYKKVLVDSVNRIHCPTLYRALCKVEKKVHVNKKMRYAFAKMLYLAAVRGEYNYDDIQEHLRHSMDVFVSSPESRQLVLYAGVFSTYHINSGKSVIEEIICASDIETATSTAAAAATAFQEDMRACVKGMPLSVPPLYCYNKWRKDVKKLESRRHLSTGFFAGVKKNCNARIAVMGSDEGSDCGDSEASFEDVMACDLDDLLRAESIVSGRPVGSMKSLNSDDEDDDFAPLPAPKKVSKLSKFKKIAFGVLMTLPSDEKDVLQISSKQRKNGLQYLYQSGTTPEQQRMIACLIRGEVPTGEKPKVDSGPSGQEGEVPATIDLDDDASTKAYPVGGVGIVATDDIARGYFIGTRLPCPSAKPSSDVTSQASRFPFNPTRLAGNIRAEVSPTGSCSSGQESPESTTISYPRRKVDLDWDEVGKTAVPSGVVVYPDERCVIIDSIPTSPKPQTKTRIGALSLRKVTIIESSVYAPPTPSPTKVKVSSPAGMAKLHLLRQSSSFNARQELSPTARCQTMREDNDDPYGSTSPPHSTFQSGRTVDM